MTLHQIFEIARHRAAIAALERREMEAEARHQWAKAKNIRESISWLEHHPQPVSVCVRPCQSVSNTNKGTQP